ncbi:MAG: YggT family protein [Synechococcales cyanobacterium T60_A2020_003]|nr:YggT family protein [Synechococcales cyanobacterium T60_A2020_003]
MNSTTALLATSIGTFLNFYVALIIIRILLSWFPTVNWMSQPFAALSQITDPYLNLFRSFIPPLGGLDLSPILAIFLLQFVARAVNSVAIAYPM